jgi:acetyltransferase-like isoleucine patch superfamily enzyme
MPMFLKILRILRVKLCQIAVTIIWKIFGIDTVSRLLYVVSPFDCATILRTCGADVGEHFSIHLPIAIVNAQKNYSNLSIGHSAHIGTGVILDLHEKITLGDRVTISMGTTIITHQYVGNSALTYLGYPPISGAVEVKSNTYVGAKAVILCGHTIGSHCVIGASAVINKDIPDYSVVVGVPGKIIKTINRSDL